MKKFFDRLRRWLIKKLGGYTEQFTPIQRQIGWRKLCIRKRYRHKSTFPYRGRTACTGTSPIRLYQVGKPERHHNAKGDCASDAARGERERFDAALPVLGGVRYGY